MTITPNIFRAYLNCPMKCWLLAAGENPTGNIYAEWIQAQTNSYRVAAANRLLTQMPSSERIQSPYSSQSSENHPSTQDLKSANWRLAFDLLCIAGENQLGHISRYIATYPSSEPTKQEARVIESRLDAVEHIPSEGRGRPSKFIPIRFVFQNKFDNDERMLLAFDALTLSGVLGRPIGFGKIIHGDKHATIKVKTSGMDSQLRNHIMNLTALLSSPSPPDLSLNRHCTECEFQTYCRRIATEKDDLSLLSNMSEKERQKHRAKGIFTVTQISYTFRPRRRARKENDKREKYHYSLKALAIRQNKIHITGNPELKIEGIPVYLDVEGLPDSDFYYLIGMRIGCGQSAIQHSLWANEINDEQRIWNDFLVILASVKNPVLIHYGSYETTFITRMHARYSGFTENSVIASVLQQAINLVSIIFAQFYFPCYSNGLKDITRSLGGTWSEKAASGLASIVWRHQWERARSGNIMQKLITYNAEDCAALELVTDTIRVLCRMKANPSTTGGPNFVDVDSLRREKIYPLGRNEFVNPALEQINKAAYWDYQRNRIFLRTDQRVKAAVQKLTKKQRKSVGINQTIELVDRPLCCPKCGNEKFERHRWSTKIVEDLKFSKSGVKRWIIQYRFLGYMCCSCRSSLSVPDRPWMKSKYGENLRSYIIFHLIELRVSQRAVNRSLNQLFGMDLPHGVVEGQKLLASKVYVETYERIISHIVSGELIHADETKISIDRCDAFVWVFANHDAVAYVYTDSRDGAMIQELLREFKGVLVSDFYAVYDSIDCPQQKCLIHLIRDMNEDALKQPFNDELISIIREFSELLKLIVETIDRFGLKKRFLRKHKKHVARFKRSISAQRYKTEVAIKYQKRFDKNTNKLFTFLDYDNVPWNNNNAEHAIKPFAMLRNVIGGASSPKGIREYLVLLSVEETCKYRGIDFLDFLRSGELDIDRFKAGAFVTH